jgi:glutamine---fructose-6-phosphate transaminase (isomerizing)
VVVSDKRPGEIVASKNVSLLVLGEGQDESFLAADVPAILEHTRDVVYLDEGEHAVVTAEKIAVFGREGEPVEPTPRRIEWSACGRREGRPQALHAQEIFEQPPSSPTLSAAAPRASRAT